MPRIIETLQIVLLLRNFPHTRLPPGQKAKCMPAITPKIEQRADSKSAISKFFSINLQCSSVRLNTVTMFSVLLLLALASGAQASYYGIVYTYSVGDLQEGVYPAINSLKMSFSSCEEFDLTICDGPCTGLSVYVTDESSGEWCQKEYIFSFSVEELNTLNNSFSSSNWTENRNGIEQSQAAVFFDLRKRSDINKPNSSPQTTILPLVRVPSNCQRNINLLVSDPDGDDVGCRNAADFECVNCTPPSVLSVSSACSLSFSPTNISAEGSYAVQLMMEDFPRQNITLTNRNSSQEMKTTSDAITRMPIQFVFKVDPAAPSCTEGLYLPRFLPPTPEHGAQIHANVSQTMEISVRAEATQAVITELLFSGPNRAAKRSSGLGNFTLTWTPSASDGGMSNTLCFVVQANFSNSVYQSDLRCIIVTVRESPVPVSPQTTPLPTIFTAINQLTTQLSFKTTPPPNMTLPMVIQNSTPEPGPYYVLALDAKISTTLTLEKDLETIKQQIKEELLKQGLPSDMLLELLISTVEVTTT